MILALSVTGGLVVFLVVVEYAKRVFKLPTELTRKTAHVGAGLVAVVAPSFLTPLEIVHIALFFALLLLFVRRKDILTSIHRIGRTSYGDIFFPFGIALAALLFLPQGLLAYQFGVLVATCADTLASLIGSKFPVKVFTLFGYKKSLFGSCVFFVVTLLFSALLLPFSLGEHVGLAFTLTCVEFFGGYGYDNLLLPTVGASLVVLFLT